MTRFVLSHCSTTNDKEVGDSEEKEGERERKGMEKEEMVKRVYVRVCVRALISSMADGTYAEMAATQYERVVQQQQLELLLSSPPFLDDCLHHARHVPPHTWSGDTRTHTHTHTPWHPRSSSLPSLALPPPAPSASIARCSLTLSDCRVHVCAPSLSHR